MRYQLKVLGPVLVAAVLMGVSFVAGAVLQPTTILKAWTCLTERDAARKQIRLGQMLRQGMTSDQVKAILGEPGRAEDVENGLRWFYYWGGCAGNDLVVEFRLYNPAISKGEARLCYAHNSTAACLIFTGSADTDPKYFTIGRPLTSR